MPRKKERRDLEHVFPMRLDDETYTALSRVAEELNRPKSMLVRILLHRVFVRKEIPFDPPRKGER